MHILVIRLSAMGDVAMTIPVVKEALVQNPNLEITYLTRPGFASLFNFSNRLHFVPVYTNDEHKGAVGLYKLYKSVIKERKIDAFADLHGVLRSQILSIFFALSGVKIARIDKGRAGKKGLTQKENKKLIRQKHTTQRYADVFKQLGLYLDFNENERKQYLHFSEDHHQKINKKNIGIAPFAQHLGKTYPLDKMEKTIAQLSQNKNLNIYLFGGGQKEAELLNPLAKKYNNTFAVAEGFSLPQQLSLMQDLDLMISMDSANMHFASLVGLKTVSIWGATHYYAGFLGVGQAEDDVVEISTEELNCRPCSVFGNKPCFRGDYACMQNIEPEVVVNKITQEVFK